MNVDDLVIQAVAEAHRENPSELQQAIGALIREHEARNGVRLQAEQIQIQVDMQKTPGGLVFTYGLLVLPPSVIPIKPVVRKRKR